MKIEAARQRIETGKRMHRLAYPFIRWYPLQRSEAWRCLHQTVHHSLKLAPGAYRLTTAPSGKNSAPAG